MQEDIQCPVNFAVIRIISQSCASVVQFHCYDLWSPETFKAEVWQAKEKNTKDIKKTILAFFKC